MSQKDVARVAALEQRIFSPCCYRETLDRHESDIATELRGELRERVARGDTSEEILADMARRYGDNVLTQPPRAWTSLWLFSAPAVLSAGLIVLALRLARRRAAVTEATALPLPPDDPERDLLEERLFDELADLD